MPRTRGNRHGVADREGSTRTKSKVVVWSVIALGLACGAASAIMLAVAYLIWIAPRKKLDELDIARDAAGVLVYRSFPFSGFECADFRVNFDRPRCKESLGSAFSYESTKADRERLSVFGPSGRSRPCRSTVEESHDISGGLGPTH
jgi:hypothetical protein